MIVVWQARWCGWLGGPIQFDGKAQGNMQVAGFGDAAERPTIQEAQRNKGCKQCCSQPMAINMQLKRSGALLEESKGDRRKVDQ